MRLEGFLKEVVDYKRIHIDQCRQQVPLKALREKSELAQKPADFLKNLKSNTLEHVGIIAEIKKASPSKGDINIDLDPEQYAQQYTQAGATAISVLTEDRYFKGSLSDLKVVCQITDLPVLRKDFTISSYQIYEACAAGAGSILLITSILSDSQLKDYISLSRELQMEPLVEIISEKELEKAYYCDAKAVGINNRNLQTLEMDLTVSKRIGPEIPEEMVCVEASGISSRQDIENGIKASIRNFLVGESIVRADDPVEFIKDLMNVST